MRRKDREKDKEFAFEVIDSAPYGVAAFTDEKGMPYSVPLSFVRSGEYLYFHSAKEGKKVDTIRNDPRICVSFANNVMPAMDQFTTGYDSAMVRGVVTQVTDKEEIIEALRKISEHFCPTNMDRFDEAVKMSIDRTAIFKVKIEEITGKQKKLTYKDYGLE